MTQREMKDIYVQNCYPDSDTIHISDTNDDWNITIFRQEDGQVSVIVVDNNEMSRMDLILGVDGYTHKC